MKIHPLRHGVSFHPSVSSFFFPKGKSVDQLAASSHKTAVCTRYVPAINIVVNRHDVFACTYIVNFIMHVVI